MGERIEFKDASIKWPHFSKRGMYAPSFRLILTPEEADDFARKGYNVEVIEPRNEDEPALPSIRVKIKTDYEWQVPVIMKYDRETMTKRTLDKDEFSILDTKQNWVDYNPQTDLIDHVDLEIDGYSYEGNMYARLVNLHALIKSQMEVSERYSNFAFASVDDDDTPF